MKEEAKLAYVDPEKSAEAKEAGNACFQKGKKIASHVVLSKLG